MKAPRPRRQAAEKRGRKGEFIAALFLRAKGYRILGSRVKTPVGEIDLVVRRGPMVAFVEVKARPSFAQAAEAIHPAARSRIAAAARAWLAMNPRYAGHDARFDAIFIVPRRWPRHLADAFDAGGKW